MKILGLLGGMSWESTLPYYRLINETVRDRLGGLHSARIVLYSVDFADIELLQRSGDWQSAGAVLADAARMLVAASAEAIVLCTNTMHRVADTIEAAVPVPFLHIADATGIAIRRAGLTRVGLLGTRFTMEQAFYRDRLRQQHGIETVIPDAAGRDDVHRIIYDELCRGRIEAASRDHYRRIIDDLVRDGAQGIIFGCTEIGLLVSADDSHVPVFDTAAIHAVSAAEHAIAS